MKKDINLKYVEEILRKKNEDKLVLKPTFFMTKNPMIQLELISKDGTTLFDQKNSIKSTNGLKEAIGEIAPTKHKIKRNL